MQYNVQVKLEFLNYQKNFVSVQKCHVGVKL